jgi:type I restriction enzyme R subunit
MFIGFTGTPLLKKDKRTSLEVFGPYIHTYKYDEAVRDEVVLDLRYEARDIDQELTSPAKIDQWFEVKTQGLTDVARAQLKQRWGTMQKVLSSQDRLTRIVDDILFDMETKPRLMTRDGNAMLVTSSIHSACRIFEMFQKTDLAGKCAIVTSYRPDISTIKGEDAGEGETEKLEQYQIYRKMLAEHFNESEDAAAGKVEQFEAEVKKRFIEQPGQMRLLIVVDKLLTGFDAPPATYLYIDKQMRDHGLFQAVCRVNRLDGEDKEYGYIVDYKDLFKSLSESIHDYTGEAFDGFDKEDVAGLLKDRLEMGRERLEEAREAVKALCEPVAPPYDTRQYVQYFCAADTTDAAALKDNEPKRVKLYTLTASLLRAYANLANEMEAAGYTEDEARAIKDEVAHFTAVRDEVKQASGDGFDMKQYEPAMRRLLDTYIRAEESRVVSSFGEKSLVQFLVEYPGSAINGLAAGIRKDDTAVAETIENNVRRVIIDEMAVNPKYYEKMAALLDALIRRRREEALAYREYLAQIVDLARQVQRPESGSSYPSTLTSKAQQALYDNLGANASLAVKVDQAIRRVTQDDWRNNQFKQRIVQRAIREELRGYDEKIDPETLFELVKNQRDY